jgi:hypothetical protein
MRLMNSAAHQKISILNGLMILLLLNVGTVCAQVKPDDFITPDNASKVKDFVSPGVFYKVQHGMTMKIVPTLRIDWPPPYKDATEKYSSQVTLSKDHRTVVGYVAGQPFPLIDANDPDVATKVVWNNVFRPIQSDDYDLRYFDCDTVYTGYTKPFSEIWYYQRGITRVMTWWAEPRSSRCPPIPTSRRPTASGCFCSALNSRPRTVVAPVCCAIDMRARLMAMTLGLGRPVRGACAV